MINITPQGVVIGRPVISGSSGAILYVDSSGNLAQDVNNLNYDSTNVRLGIGVAVPLTKIHTVGGNARFDNSGAAMAMIANRSDGVAASLVAGSLASGFRFSTSGNNQFKISSQGNSDIIAGNAVGITDIIVISGAAPANSITVSSTGLLFVGKFINYNNINTVGWGVPAIYGTGRSTAQTAAVASVATYTVGAADGSFIISANANITAFVAGTFNVTVAYTDETNTAQTLKLNFSSVTGTLGIALAAAGPFEGIPAHIRCKASTTITIATSGTFTSLTYNVEGYITQIG